MVSKSILTPYGGKNMMSGQEISRKPVLIFGLLLLIFSIIGLVLCFSTPWFEREIDGDRETYYYGDFNENFEEDWGSEMDRYYNDSANFALIGFVIIILISILVIVEGIRGSISNFISRYILHIPLGTEPKLRQSAFIVIIILLLLIPITLTIVSGTRFIGITGMLQATTDSIQTESSTSDFSFSSLAGYSVTIIGLIIFVLCLFFMIKNLFNLRLSSDQNYERRVYTNKMSKIALLFIVFSIIGFITIPVLSFMNLEYKQSINVDEISQNYEVTTFYNDGMIHIDAERGSGDEIDDLKEDLEWNISLISWMLLLTLIFCIIIILGILFYSVGRLSIGAHLFISLGILILIFAILGVIGYGLVGSVIGEIDKEYQQMSTVGSEDTYFEQEWHAVMGSNFIPLIMAIIILIISILYIRTVWPFSVAILLGRRAPEAPPIPPAPFPAGETPPDLPVEGTPAEIPRPKPTPTHSRIPGKPIPRNIITTIIIVIIIIIAGAAGAFFLFSGDDEKKKSTGSGGVTDYQDLPSTSDQYQFSEYSAEDTEIPIPLMTEHFNETIYVRGITATLEWQDEADHDLLHDNDPDEFKLQITSPTGEVWESEIVANEQSSKQGYIELSTGVIDPPIGWEEDLGPEDFWVLTIVCLECGDHTPKYVGALLWNDTGNGWTSNVEISYYFESSEET